MMPETPANSPPTDRASRIGHRKKPFARRILPKNRKIILLK